MIPMRSGSSGSGRLRSSSNNPLGVKFSLQRLIAPLEYAFARRLEFFNDQLVVTARLVEADLSIREYVIAILEADGGAALTVAEERGAHLGRFVL